MCDLLIRNFRYNRFETHQMKHPIMWMDPCHVSNRNIQSKWQILNERSHIHFLHVCCLYRWQLAEEAYWTPEIQEAVQLY
jgi:hypothetical protein